MLSTFFRGLLPVTISLALGLPTLAGAAKANTVSCTDKFVVPSDAGTPVDPAQLGKRLLQCEAELARVVSEVAAWDLQSSAADEAAVVAALVEGAADRIEDWSTLRGDDPTLKQSEGGGLPESLLEARARLQVALDYKASLSEQQVPEPDPCAKLKSAGIQDGLVPVGDTHCAAVLNVYGDTRSTAVKDLRQSRTTTELARTARKETYDVVPMGAEGDAFFERLSEKGVVLVMLFEGETAVGWDTDAVEGMKLILSSVNTDGTATILKELALHASSGHNGPGVHVAMRGLDLSSLSDGARLEVALVNADGADARRLRAHLKRSPTLVADVVVAAPVIRFESDRGPDEALPVSVLPASVFLGRESWVGDGRNHLRFGAVVGPELVVAETPVAESDEPGTAGDAGTTEGRGLAAVQMGFMLDYNGIQLGATTPALQQNSVFARGVQDGEVMLIISVSDLLLERVGLRPEDHGLSLGGVLGSNN